MINHCLECERRIGAGRMWCDDCIKDIFFITDELIETEEKKNK
ncbi:hypothetical protein [Lactococcus phage PLG-II]|nr:hypothetical protein [Lactococcus phage PLG-II]